MSNELDIKFPEIFYDKKKYELYSYLKSDPQSPFRESTFAGIFIFAMALAKRRNMTPEKIETPAKLEPYAFGSDMRVLMRSIMIAEKKDAYSIRDNTALRRLCEGYANAGIDLLYLKVKERPDGQYGEDVFADLLKS